MGCRKLHTYQYTCDGWLGLDKPCDRQRTIIAPSRLYSDAEMKKEHAWTETGIDGWLCPLTHAGRMTDDRITEADVADEEIAGAMVWVRCEECDDAGEAMTMCRQNDGAWLCGRCDREHRADAEDTFRTERGW